MTSPNPTIAFFGATGGCVNGALVNALRGGHHVIALARTPSKLTSQLQAQGISESVLSNQLVVVAGNALEKDDVKRTLTFNEANKNNKNNSNSSNNSNQYLVKSILTGLGGTPSFIFNWKNPLDCLRIDNPTICADAASTLLTALAEIYAEQPSLRNEMPRLTFISTTGITRGPEDVPFGMRLLYHYGLAEPHKDKRNMENFYRDNNDGKDGHGRLFADIVGVRPTLLTGGVVADEGVGVDKIRAGTEDQPETGFTITRADVGRWIYENALTLARRTQWANQMVTLTS